MEPRTSEPRLCQWEGCAKTLPPGSTVRRRYCDRSCKRKAGRALHNLTRPVSEPRPADICTVDGCDKLARSKTWCSRHYDRWLQHGDPTGGGPDKPRSVSGRCEATDCDGPHYGRGLCRLHWKRDVDRSNWKTKQAEYIAWCSMKARCLNPNNKSFAHYGGRGIRITEAWLNDFPSFLAYMGPRPAPEYSVDRIDVDGNYEPGNVRWATPHQQKLNQRPKNQCGKQLHDLTPGSPHVKVRPDGSRACLPCMAERQRERRNRRKKAS